MKKFGLILFVLLVSIPLAAYAQTGNGAPNGSHYNLNLLGKDNCSPNPLLDSQRHTIQVLLHFSDPDPDNILGNHVCPSGDPEDPECAVTMDKRNKIFLVPGSDFEVTDGNACDKDGAWFTMPTNVATEYTIWVRELGKPGKIDDPAEGDIVLCGISDMGTEDPSDDEVVCNTGNMIVPLKRETGKSSFRNVTHELTTIEYQIVTGYDANGDPILVADTATLFDEDFYQYFWDFDNNGLRLVQLRFYPVPVTQ